MQTSFATETSEATRTSEYDYRVLFLSGTWRTPIGSEFRLRATIYVQKDGGADGAIYWRAVKVRGGLCCYFGTESVSGSVSGHSVYLLGRHVDPGLALDEYRIHLTGSDEAGRFDGTSRAYGDWSGVLVGTYHFQNRKKG